MRPESSRRVRKNRIKAVRWILGAAAVAYALPALAADQYWINPAGGVFSDPGNWQGGNVPTSADNANFNLASPNPYTVTLSAPAAVTQMSIDQDNVALDLSGYTFKTSSTDFTQPSLGVGLSASATGILSVRNGTLALSSARIGDYGAGTVTVSGATAISTPLGTYMGFRAGSSGVVSLTGPQASWTSAGYFVGENGTGTLNISGGASVMSTETAVLGDGATSQGTVTITGQGSSWSGANDYFDVGYSGRGTVSVLNGASLSVTSLALGYVKGATGTLTVDGSAGSSRSTVSVTGSSAQNAATGVGYGGSGTLNITNGALFSANDFVMGGNLGAGTVNVSGNAAGNDAELKIGGMLMLGRVQFDQPSYGGGKGSLVIGAGGSVVVAGTTYMGATGAAPGTGTITLNGGTFSTHGLSALPGSGIVQNGGTLIVDGGTFAPATATLSIGGATAADVSTVRFVNGATANLSGPLYVGGSASASSAGPGALNVESGSNVAFAGATKLWTGGTLNISGGTFKTASIQQAGGTLNFTSGGLYLTQSNFNLGTTGLLGPSINLTANAGELNALSISGISTLDAGSSLTINGGTFSTGKLVNNGGTFSFNTGAFALTQDNLEIGAGAPLGGAINLTSGRSLSVSGVVTIDAGSSLAINGGAFSASSLVNNGSFDFVSGTLGGSSDLVIDPGSLLGANLSVGASRNVVSSQGLIVGKKATATMTISGGGTASSARGYIGQLPGSNGTVSVDGTGSMWSIASTLAVGGSDSAAGGVAALNITNGGAVSAGSGVTIYSKAAVTVDGGALAGASISNRGTLQLGSAAAVSGTVTNTGTMTKFGDGAASLNNTLNNNGTLQVNAGLLTLAGGAGVSGGSFSVASGATLEFAGPRGFTANSTLGASSSLTGAGAVLASSGDHVLQGTVNVPQFTVGDAQLLIESNAAIGHLILTGGDPNHYPGIYAFKTLSVNTLDFSGGTVNGPGTINVSGPITIDGAGWKRIISGTLNAAGSTLWTGNSVVLGLQGSVFNNLATGVFEARHDIGGTLPVFGSGSDTFNNYGSFIKSTGNVWAEVDSVFNNYGTVSLQAGTLVLAGGGTHAGSFMGAAGTTLEIGSSGAAPTNYAASASLVSAGDVNFVGTATNFSGHYNVAGTTHAQDLNFLAGADVQNLGSAFIASATTTFSTGVPQVLPPTTLDNYTARIGGTDDLTMNAPLNWMGGYVSGTGVLHLKGGAVLSSSAAKYIDVGRTVENAGLITWSDGAIEQAGTLTNLASGTIDIQGSAPLEFNLQNSPPTFNNAGTLLKSAGNGTNILPFFNNTGTVQVKTGSLIFARGASSTGSYSVAGGALLGFAYNNAAFASSASITGNGDVAFREVNADFLGQYNVAGSTTVGSATASGDTTQLTFEPGSSAANLGAQTTINNYGTLTLNTGKTVLLHNLTVWGMLNGSDPVTIDGTVNGRGVIGTQVVNDGTVSPGASPGTLTILGDYAQEPAAFLHMEFAPASLVGSKYLQQFDILNVGGTARLGGALDLAMLDGYVPNVGDSFTILTYASRTGEFDSIIGQDPAPGRHFDLVYGPGSLQVVVAAPEPAVAGLLGFVCVGLLFRRRFKGGVTTEIQRGSLLKFKGGHY